MINKKAISKIIVHPAWIEIVFYKDPDITDNVFIPMSRVDSFILDDNGKKALESLKERYQNG